MWRACLRILVFPYNPYNAFRLVVKSIKAEFVSDPQYDEDAGHHASGQAENVDDGVGPVL